ncbi:fatty acyl-AMP ligase [Nonomuraea sp. NPDC051191]|uniref:fatty acyl-AMP ligase n=1 Tax=Nonomuraea sp. NPDC051191 TaxID=3364372 RepID=UPI0037A448C5
MLRSRAHEHPDRQAVGYQEDDGRLLELSYQELDRRARALAAMLRQCGADGERALLLYPPGLDFVVAFYGCLYAGTVAVPTHPPRRRTLDRLRGLAADARPAIVLTTSALAEVAGPATSAAPALAPAKWIYTDTVVEDLADEWSEPELRADSIAFLQYTSGSTASPRGVAVSHGNIMHNSAMIRDCFGHGSATHGVIWLPPQHDMGLIGGVIQPIFSDARITLLSPLAFLQRPLLWLETISRTRATTSGAPNFAYELCARKITPQQLSTLDLSCWDLAFTGAEPVRSATLERFADTFAASGFRREAFYPCYGLAEATLLATGGVKGTIPRTHTVQAGALEDGRVITAERGADDSRTLVSCGRPWSGQQVAIVDPETTRRVTPGRVGEVWITGRSVARQYWGRPVESEQVFRARLADADGDGEPWLRTGDLGYLDEGELFLVGRLKDLVVVDGRNHYPEDIEQVVEGSHEHLRPHGCAAFSVDGPIEEQVVVVAEVEIALARRTGAGLDADAVIRQVRKAVAEKCDVRVHEVVLVRPGGVPRTTSGKIRRGACRRDFLAGTLNALGSSQDAPGR